MKDAGVVEDDVEFAERILGKLHHRFAIGCFRDVCSKRAGVVADLIRSRFGRFFFQIDDDDLRAFLCEKETRCFADSGAAAGDEGYFVLQSHDYAISKYRRRSQSVTTASNFRCSVRKKWR